jgi:hypothetical protein
MPRIWLVYVSGFIVLFGGIAAAIQFDLITLRQASPRSDSSSGGIAVMIEAANSKSPAAPEPQLPPGIQVRFVDVTEKAGIHFEHFDGHTEMEYIMETLGPGVAWLDYDQDGLMDLFLVQGSSFPTPSPALHPWKTEPTCKLFKNLGGGRFRDVTAEAGLDHVGCGLGVAIGDIDNDGFPDLFLTCYGKPNVLYHNVSDGKGGRRFVDITKAAGLGDHPDWKNRPNFSTSAAFLDFDNDGYLDLFVCSYVKVDFDVATDEEIKITVVIEVQESSAGAEIRPIFPIGMIAEARCLSDVDKPSAALAVAHIVIKHVGLPVAGQEKVGKAVIIDVADSDAEPAANVVEAGLGGDIPESPAAQVLEELTSRLRFPRMKGRGGRREA